MSARCNRALARTAAAREANSLVVLGTAKDGRMERIQFGGPVGNLVRHCPVPVLNVRSRARSAYRNVVVATGFAQPAGQSLALAARCLPDARLTLFRAYRPSAPAPAGVRRA